MKITWKALRDMRPLKKLNELNKLQRLMGHSVPREIAHGPEGEGHQSNKEKGGESQYSVNHFPLGNEVHKISGDKECLAAGNKKRDTDVDFAISELDVRRA